MSDGSPEGAPRGRAPAPPVVAKASVLQIFVAFLIIGSTSFGGAVPYLRERLVARRKWLDDKRFVELLSISQSLPGLNPGGAGRRRPCFFFFFFFFFFFGRASGEPGN